MKFPQFPRLTLTVAACLAAISSTAFAQDTTPPYVNKPINDITVSANASPTFVSLKKTFRLTGVTGQVVRFTTDAGNIDAEIFTDKTPRTAATFLSYATPAGDNSRGIYTYANTLIQRAVPKFVVQGGGFFVDSTSQINQILNRSTIASEAGIKNTPGTIAMALSNGPDSGTGDFFFNIVANTNLDDNSNGGPFTVFGRVLGVLPDPNRTADLTTLDKIEALPQRDFSTQLGGSFTNVPLVRDNETTTVDDLLYLRSVVPIGLIPKKAGAPSVLKLKIKNSNRNLVTAVITGRNLVLNYTPGATGTATIKVRATNPVTTSRVLATFKVTVQ